MITFHTPLETGEFMGINFQTLADDLTTSAARLVVVGTFISPLTTDEQRAFRRLVATIRSEGEWQGSYDDQTDYYSWCGHQLAVWGRYRSSSVDNQENGLQRHFENVGLIANYRYINRVKTLCPV